MTKTGVALALLCLALLAPAASAHGAAAAREIDTRLLTDKDGAFSFGGCVDGNCPGVAVDGVDLVVLEVREARLPDGSPAIVFRTIYQTGDEDEGRSVTLALTAGGQERSFTFETTGTSPATSADFDKVAGPFDAFDGFPKAVDGYLKYATLGVKAGDQLTGIHVTSAIAGEEADLMPGTWNTEAGGEVPFVPNPEEPTETTPGEAATYTLKGPATLFTATADAKELKAGKSTFNLTLTNPLQQTEQLIQLKARGPGVDVDLAPGVKLDPGATKTVEVRVVGAGATLNVTATSDLDDYASLKLPIASKPAAVNTTTPTAAATSSTAPSKKSPAPTAVLAVGLACLAVARRRWP